MDMMKVGIVVLAMVVATIGCCHAQSGLDAVGYLNHVETEVIEITSQATINFFHTCELVASCAGNCSRQACLPLSTDESGYVCKQVANNPSCYSLNGSLGCQNVRVSMARSFVRLPTGPSVGVIEQTNSTICSQRMLDSTLKNISSSHNSNLNLTSWTYFASVEGVHRAFPGRVSPSPTLTSTPANYDTIRSKVLITFFYQDLNTTNCIFEPRKRPWYQGVTAIQKDVVVLLNSGESMGLNLPGDLLLSNGTKFQAAVSILTQFLDTLATGDLITIITFNSTSTPSQVLSPMTVNGTNVQLLTNALQYLVPDVTQGVSNLTAAFLLANKTLQSSNALKVILTFTDGQVTPVNLNASSTGNVFDSIRTQMALVQFYSFDRSPVEMNALSAVACYCSGTYERILISVSNPLWTLRSYFGILARLRLKATNEKPVWTAPYADNGNLGQVITVAYPAFDLDNYTLIGVAGIDVLIDELGSNALAEFSSALTARGNTEPVTSVVSASLPCNFSLSTANNCSNVVPPANSFCQMNDSSLTFKERVCNCPGVCLASLYNQSKNMLTTAQVVGVGIGAAVVFIALVAVLLLFLCRRKLQSSAEDPLVAAPFPDTSGNAKFGSIPNSPSSKSPMGGRGHSLRANSGSWGSQASKDLIEYTLEQLQDATDNWNPSAVLGRGAHGLVYKGVFKNGTLAAIKKPSRDLQQDAWDTFATELEVLSKLNHKRLVRLLGYCKDEIILVYEFMENGTLADWLHGPDHAGAKLGWEGRLKIAMGAAKGLEYLHEYANPKIYHGDVKPANILLDQNWEAHVSDFGLSLWSQDEKMSYLMASRMGGTFGYLDPEFVSSGQATYASDVYSFGIVLLELLSGRPVVVEFENIKDWAAQLEEEDNLDAVLDPNCEVPMNTDVLIEIIELALKCVARRKQDRPKMKDVSSFLDRKWNHWVRSGHSIPDDYSGHSIPEEYSGEGR